MIVDISLILIFVASIFTLWHRISVKVPELIAIPDEVITSRLHEDSAKFRVFAIRLKSAYEEKRIQAGLIKVLGKFLYRFHIVIMRLDNWILSWLKKIRESGYYASSGNGNVSSGLTNNDFPSNSPRHHKVEEVRVKK